MFTWICPNCGGEVPPSYTECPHCAAKAAAAQEQKSTATQPAAAPAIHTSVAHETRPPSPIAVEPPPPAPPPPVVAPIQPAAPTQPHAFAPGSILAPPPETSRTNATEAPARSLSPAIIAFLAGAATVALIAVLYLLVGPRHKEAAANPASTAIQNPGGPGSAASAHPLAKHLEVMGVRVVEGEGGRTKIHFVVVNHSGADLPELAMQMTLAAGGRQFFSFPVKLPSIGPYESRDLTATVKTDLKPYELPDWQVVQPQFRITSQP